MNTINNPYGTSSPGSPYHPQLSEVREDQNNSMINASNLEIYGIYPKPSTFYQVEKYQEVFQSLEDMPAIKHKKRRKRRKAFDMNMSPGTRQKIENDKEKDKYRCYKRPLPFQAFPDQAFQRKTIFDSFPRNEGSDVSREGSPDNINKSSLPDIKTAQKRPQTTIEQDFNIKRRKELLSNGKKRQKNAMAARNNFIDGDDLKTIEVNSMSQTNQNFRMGALTQGANNSLLDEPSGISILSNKKHSVLSRESRPKKKQSDSSYVGGNQVRGTQATTLQVDETINGTEEDFNEDEYSEEQLQSKQEDQNNDYHQ